MTPRIDFYNFAVQILPPEKRSFTYWKAWFKSLSSQSVRLNKIHNDFIDGSQADYWDNSTSYDFDDETVYKYRVYKSLIDGNVGVQPDSDITKWQLILNSFIGTDEFSKYRPLKLTLEYALNHYFKQELFDNSLVGFRQPDSPTTPTNSDIYLSNLPPAYVSFVSFASETLTSKVYSDKASDFSFATEIYGAATSYQFTVNIPSAVYASINANPIIADTIIRTFLDTYISSGIFYTIITY